MRESPWGTHSTREEDHVLQTGSNNQSHHPTFFVSDAKLDSRGHLETFNTPSPRFSFQDRGRRSNSALPGNVAFIRLLAYGGASVHRLYPHGRVMQASCQPDLITGHPHLCSLEKSRRCRGNCLNTQVPSETNGVRASDFRQSLVPNPGCPTWGLIQILIPSSSD